MNKESIYEAPEMQVIRFGNEVVMSESGGGGIELPEDEW